MKIRIGIDIGAEETRVVITGEEPCIFCEPSLVALDAQGKPIACGKLAEEQSKRFPGAVSLVYPFSFDSPPNEIYAKAFFSYLFKEYGLKGSEAFISFSSLFTEEAEQVFVEAIQKAGSRDVITVDATFAATFGVNVKSVSESVIVNIGKSTVGIVGYVHGKTKVRTFSKFGGSAFDSAILSYYIKNKRVRLFDSDVGRIKKELVSLSEESDKSFEVTALSVSTGLPKTVTVTAKEASSAVETVFDELADDIISVIKKLPCEPTKIILAGGGARLGGIDSALSALICLPAEISPEPELAVLRGLNSIILKQDTKK